MKSIHKKQNKFRWLGAVLVCCSLLSCGTETAEDETETAAAEIDYPSIGVGRPETTEPEPAEPTGITICIDPGHGFTDDGCSSDFLAEGTKEKHWTLLYANELKEKLEFLGYEVVQSHDGESFPEEFNSYSTNIFSADERAGYINTLDVDFMVSLHCDSFDEDASIGGARVYYYDTDIKVNASSDGISNSISAYLAKEFPDAKVPSVHGNQSYKVLRLTTMAASLVEIGFISNETDAKNIQDPAWMDKFVNGVAQGIHNYYSLNP